MTQDEKTLWIRLGNGREYAEFIREQWEKLGLGLDYSRERFTLDDGLSDAVKKVFVTLYNKGLIYRGQYIINWDPEAKTALSDIEVIHKDIEGSFYHLKYPLTDGSGYLEVATTRPETIPGDTAVAVHPKDERYQHLIGKTIMLPILNREIPIVADEYVEESLALVQLKLRLHMIRMILKQGIVMICQELLSCMKMGQ